MQHNAVLAMFVMVKRSSDNRIKYFNDNLIPIDMYNGLYQVHLSNQKE